MNVHEGRCYRHTVAPGWVLGPTTDSAAVIIVVLDKKHNLKDIRSSGAPEYLMSIISYFIRSSVDIRNK